MGNYYPTRVLSNYWKGDQVKKKKIQRIIDL